MILQSLRAMAFRERLLDNPDYEPKAVAWVISIGDGGRYLGLIATVDQKKFSVPRRCRNTSNAQSDFLVEKSEYVLGVCHQEALPKPRSTEELARRRGLFRQWVEEAAHETHSPALQAAVAFLADGDAIARCAAEAEAKGYKNNDLFALQYGGRLIHELPESQEYFSRARHAEAGEKTTQCLVCGQMRSPVDKHPGVKVPGGVKKGAALVSFNKGAFESFGLSRNENAPVCRECADAYTTALNRCLDRNYPSPEGEVMARRSIGLSPDTTAIYWAAEQSATVDLFASLLFDKADPEAVRSLFEAAAKGAAPASLEAVRFYCLILSGAQGRAVVRGMHTGTVAAVERNVCEYFRSLDVGQPAPLPLFPLRRGGALQGKFDDPPPALASEMFLAILFALPFPRLVLSAAVGRCRAERKISRERAALLRAYLIRNHKLEVSVGLDKDNNQPGYRLGRLLAALERLQSDAQNNPNKTIVDRYYGAASTRPATVFPALLRLAQHHAAKLNSAGYHQARLGEILQGLDGFPATLRLDEQGLFALGYYHQRQEFFRRKESEPQPESATGATA